LRVERLLNQETGAADQFLPGADRRSSAYAEDADRFRATMAGHLQSLRIKVEGAAESIVPNLSRVVGPLVAARLVSEAGGLDRLAKMSAPSLQLLGAGKRLSIERRPRHGVIFRAERMNDVPPSGRGAYARSLAALAAIAARADATTRSAVGLELVRRRDRRVEQLRRQRK
jgi:nucleolar protein 56